ncbi:hypothetical protein, partial [Parachitinimonas caeni]
NQSGQRKSGEQTATADRIKAMTAGQPYMDDTGRMFDGNGRQIGQETDYYGVVPWGEYPQEEGGFIPTSGRMGATGPRGPKGGLSSADLRKLGGIPFMGKDSYGREEQYFLLPNGATTRPHDESMASSPITVTAEWPRQKSNVESLFKQIATGTGEIVQTLTREHVSRNLMPEFDMQLSDNSLVAKLSQTPVDLAKSAWEWEYNKDSNLLAYSAATLYDANQRAGYKAQAIANSKFYLSEFNKLSLDQRSGAQGKNIAIQAFGERQELRAATQSKLSPGGRIVSQAIELERTFVSQAEYSAKKIVKSGGIATESGVYERIIKSSGASNGWVSRVNTLSRILGPFAIAAEATGGAARVYNAPQGQHGLYTAQEIGSIAGGWAGGTLATMAVGGAALGLAALGITLGGTAILAAGIVVGGYAAVTTSRYGREAGGYYYNFFSRQ